jgi:O-antigen/teichoic acid export membrane protein
MVAEYSISYKLKEIFKHSIVYGLTSSLQSLLGFILLPLLTKYYTTEVFGVYSIILLINAFASAIFYLGASSALGRYYFEEESEEYKRQIITTSFLITLSGAILLILLAFTLSGYLSLWLFDTWKYATAVKLGLIGSAFGFLLTIMTVLLRYQKKSKMFLIVSITGFLLNFLITYTCLTRLGQELLSPLYGALLGNLFCFLILLTIYMRSFTLMLHKAQFRMIFIFGVQIALSSLLFYILEWADRLIIKDLLNLSDVGIYSLGYRLGSVLNIMFVLPFSLIWGPVRMEYLKNKNNNEFITKVVSYYSIIGLFFVFLGFLFGEEVMAFFFKNKAYGDAAKIFPLIMLSILFAGYQNIIDLGIYIKGKLYYLTFICIGAICFNLTLNYFFIPVFGYMAAAFVNLATYIFSSSLIYIISNKYYEIHVEWTRIFFPILFGIMCILIINLPFYSVYIKTLIKVFLLITGILFMIKFWLNKREKNVLCKIVKPTKE